MSPFISDWVSAGQSTEYQTALPSSFIHVFPLDLWQHTLTRLSLSPQIISQTSTNQPVKLIFHVHIIKITININIISTV